jgi:hypothetical protein
MADDSFKQFMPGQPDPLSPFHHADFCLGLENEAVF